MCLSPFNILHNFFFFQTKVRYLLCLNRPTLLARCWDTSGFNAGQILDTSVGQSVIIGTLHIQNCYFNESQSKLLSSWESISFDPGQHKLNFLPLWQISINFSYFFLLKWEDEGKNVTYFIWSQFLIQLELHLGPLELTGLSATDFNKVRIRLIARSFLFFPDNELKY